MQEMQLLWKLNCCTFADDAAYNLAGLLTADTNTVDLVILDADVLANISNADLSAATDGPNC